jgi:hypothetical protein
LSCGIDASPFAVCFNLLRATTGFSRVCFFKPADESFEFTLLSKLEDLGNENLAAVDLLNSLNLAKACQAVSFFACAGVARAPSGIKFLQSCSSAKRCLRQYCRLQVGQCTPGTRAVLIKVLQLGEEHC